MTSVRDAARLYADLGRAVAITVLSVALRRVGGAR